MTFWFEGTKEELLTLMSDSIFDVPGDVKKLIALYTALKTTVDSLTAKVNELTGEVLPAEEAQELHDLVTTPPASPTPAADSPAPAVPVPTPPAS